MPRDGEAARQPHPGRVHTPVPAPSQTAYTELTDAQKQGAAHRKLEESGPDELVYKMPMPTACAQCKHLYLLSDGKTPRLFRLKDMLDNGTNIGCKAHPTKGGKVVPGGRPDGAEALKAVVGVVHPYCQCQGIYTATGYEPWLTDKQKAIIKHEFSQRMKKSHDVTDEPRDTLGKWTREHKPGITGDMYQAIGKNGYGPGHKYDDDSAYKIDELPQSAFGNVSGKCRSFFDNPPCKWHITLTEETRSKFNRTTNTIEITKQSYRDKRQERSFIHEYAHLYDTRKNKQTDDPINRNEENLSANKKFKTAIQEIGRHITNDKQEINRLNGLIRSEKWKLHEEISDIFGCLTKGKVIGVYGHDMSELTDKGDIAAEIFSGLFVLAATNDQTGIDLIKTETPALWQAFEKIINKIT